MRFPPLLLGTLFFVVQSSNVQRTSRVRLLGHYEDPANDHKIAETVRYVRKRGGFIVEHERKADSFQAQSKNARRHSQAADINESRKEEANKTSSTPPVVSIEIDEGTYASAKVLQCAVIAVSGAVYMFSSWAELKLR